MKQKYEIFNTYLSIITKDIKDRRAKKEVKEEIFSHLMDHYDMNIALRMSHEEAQRKAVEKMGDTESVAKSFEQLYPISSAEYFRRSAYALAMPLMLVFSFGTLKIDFLYFFTLFVYIGLDKIKKVNKLFNIAFIITIVNAVLQSITMIMQSNFFIEKWLVLCIAFAHHTAIILIYTLILLGLIKIKKELEEPKIDIKLAIASIPLIIISNALVMLAEYFNVIGPYFIAFICNILPAAVIYTTIKAIDNLKVGIEAKKTSVKKVVFCFVIFFAITFSLLMPRNFITYIPADYIIDDEQTDITEIKNNLVNLGLPVEIANELPESEVLKYENAIKLTKHAKGDDEITLYNVTQPETEDLSESYYVVYAFTLYDQKTDTYKVRALFSVERMKEFEPREYTEFFVDITGRNQTDVFCKILCDVDGMTKEIPLVKQDVVTDDEFKDIHYIFAPTKDAENYRAYISMTVQKDDTEEKLGFYCEYEQAVIMEINDPFTPYWLRKSDYYSMSMYNPAYLAKDAEQIK